MKIKKLKISELEPMRENPNEMKDNKFNSLVGAIEELGYDQPIKVFWNENKEKYEIVKGNHRYWALRTMGKGEEDEIECVIGEYETRDQALKDMVRDNVVKGELDPYKFTELWEKISDKYGEDVTKEMFGFLEEKELDRLIKEVKEGMSDDMKEKLEEAKEEIKTIDDLSLVLNRIFNEHGDTLEYNFMTFDYLKGGKICYIQASKENWKKIEEITKHCKDKGLDINKVIKIEMYDQGNVGQKESSGSDKD